MTGKWNGFGFSALALVASIFLTGCGSAVDEQAAKRWEAALGMTSITVFPAIVRKGQLTTEHHHESTATLKAYFDESKLAKAVEGAVEVDIPLNWGRDQSRMLRDSVAAFAAWLKEHPVKTDYAMVCEYLCSSNGAVGGIHAYVLEKEGLCAYAIGLNSHHKAFNESKLEGPDDCTATIVKVMRGELKASNQPTGVSSGRQR